MNLSAHLKASFRWLRLLRRFGRPRRVFYFNGGIGDQLLCSCVLREWRRREQKRMWLMTSHPELFVGNTDLTLALPYDIWLAPWLAWNRTPVEFISYNEFRWDDEGDRDSPIHEHIIAALCRRTGLTGRVTLRPYLPAVRPPARLSPRPRPRVAVQSSCLTAKFPLANKQWPLDRIQAVVATLAAEIDFVHLGSPRDPALERTEDQRGRDVLAGARILADCDLFFGLEGFLMHLARAVECPAVIVHGGRGPAEFFGYGCNTRITQRPACSPCWFYSRCDHDRICLTDISVAEVVAAIRAALVQPAARPLPEDHADLSPA